MECCFAMTFVVRASNPSTVSTMLNVVDRVRVAGQGEARESLVWVGTSSTKNEKFLVSWMIIVRRKGRDPFNQLSTENFTCTFVGRRYRLEVHVKR